MRTAAVLAAFFGLIALTGRVEDDAVTAEAELQVEHERTYSETDLGMERAESHRYAVMVREDRICK